MSFSQRIRLPALSCALVFLAALLIGRPFAETGVVDDFSYIYTARHLAETGHVAYVGWAGAMLGWQVYFAAALFKLFGFSFTVARITTWLSAAMTVFLLQRILRRCGANERNAVIASLTFAFSPVFFMLSASFMTDVEGLFTVVVCLYCCLRAVQANDARRTTQWILSAVVSDALLGTCRQVAWLGVLVLVPSTLWLMRSRRDVVRTGFLAIAVAGVFMLSTTYWFQQQPYTISDSVAAGMVISSRAALAAHVFRQLVAALLELPLLLLPLVVMFLPCVFGARRRTLTLAAVFALVYAWMAFHWRHSHPEYLLEPTTGNWLGVYGYIQAQGPAGHGPVLLPLFVRAILTCGAVGGVLGIVVLLAGKRNGNASTHSSTPQIPFSQLAILLLPYTIVYGLLLMPRGVSELFDRYLLGLLILPLILLVRMYQEWLAQRISVASVVLLAIMAVYSVSCVHNSFAQMRAEIALDHTLQAGGVPEDHVDFGWAYNAWLELQRIGYIDNPAIRKPANAFVPVPPTVDPDCYKPPVSFRYLTLEYGISYDPTRCSGTASLPTASYRTWPTGAQTTLYVVRYTPLR